MAACAIAAAVVVFAAGCLFLFLLLDRLRSGKPGPNREWRYCPWCTGPLVEGMVDGKQKLHCSRCNFVHWNNPKPNSKLVIPTSDGGIVLVEGQSGAYELPGGYVETYELPDAGARREAKEETSLDVQIERLICMLMEPGRNELFCFYLTKPVSAAPVAGDDAVKAFVVPRTAIPFERIKSELHRRVINMWLAEIAPSTKK